jgi:hypothetical protein
MFTKTRVIDPERLNFWSFSGSMRTLIWQFATASDEQPDA